MLMSNFAPAIFFKKAAVEEENAHTIPEFRAVANSVLQKQVEEPLLRAKPEPLQ